MEKMAAMDDKVKNKLDDLDKEKKAALDKKEIERLLDEMVGRVAGEEDLKDKKSAADKMTEMEVRAVMNDMINKVTQNNIEHTIQDVVNTLSKHVTTLNTISKTQYEDFTNQLRDAFGYNMVQLQDTIANLGEEVFASKNNIIAVGNKMADLDVDTRKQMSDLSDKLEIQKLMTDLIGYVADLS